MSTLIEIANDIKAAILELAGGRDYPDLLEAVDSLLIRSSNKGYAQGVIDGKAIGPESGEQLYRRIATYEGIGKIVATYEPVTSPAPAQAPEPSSAVTAIATLTAMLHNLESAANYIDRLGGDSTAYRQALAAASQAPATKCPECDRQIVDGAVRCPRGRACWAGRQAPGAGGEG